MERANGGKMLLSKMANQTPTREITPTTKNTVGAPSNGNLETSSKVNTTKTSEMATVRCTGPMAAYTRGCGSEVYSKGSDS